MKRCCQESTNLESKMKSSIQHHLLISKSQNHGQNLYTKSVIKGNISLIELYSRQREISDTELNIGKLFYAKNIIPAN